MIKELDQIVLTADLPKEGLKAGDVGTVVHTHGGEVFEVDSWRSLERLFLS
jgi:hypothetical protein